LLEDYYIDEIPEIISAWNELHGTKESKQNENAHVNAEFDPSRPA
jgi:hypothetical protein